MLSYCYYIIYIAFILSIIFIAFIFAKSLTEIFSERTLYCFPHFSDFILSYNLFQLLKYILLLLSSHSGLRIPKSRQTFLSIQSHQYSNISSSLSVEMVKSRTLLNQLTVLTNIKAGK